MGSQPGKGDLLPVASRAPRRCLSLRITKQRDRGEALARRLYRGGRRPQYCGLTHAVLDRTKPKPERVGRRDGLLPMMNNWDQAMANNIAEGAADSATSSSGRNKSRSRSRSRPRLQPLWYGTMARRLSSDRIGRDHDSLLLRLHQTASRPRLLVAHVPPPSMGA